MKLFLFTNILVLTAVSVSWLNFLSTPDDVVRSFTTPPPVSVETLPVLQFETASAGGVM